MSSMSQVVPKWGSMPPLLCLQDKSGGNALIHVGTSHRLFTTATCRPLKIPMLRCRQVLVGVQLLYDRLASELLWKELKQGRADRPDLEYC